MNSRHSRLVSMGLIWMVTCTVTLAARPVGAGPAVAPDGALSHALSKRVVAPRRMPDAAGKGATVHVDVFDVLGTRIDGAIVTMLRPDGRSVDGQVVETGGHVLAGLGAEPAKMTIEVTWPGGADVHCDVRVPKIVTNAAVTIVVDDLGLVSMVVRPVGPDLADFAMTPVRSHTARPTGTEGSVCSGTETPEGEPPCGPEYVDAFNGGLNSDPNVFSTIVCGEMVCGETGNFVAGGLDSRDTDWYLIQLSSQTKVTWTVEAAGFAHAITTVDVSVPGGAIEGDFVESMAGEPLTVSNCLAPGDWALFVSAAGFAGVDCGATYVGSVGCAPCTAPPTGACCNNDGSCSDDVLEETCFGAGGIAFFEGNFCFFVSCPSVPPICVPGSGDCFIPNGTPGCEIPECCEAVCIADPFCCDTVWDEVCAEAAMLEPICGFENVEACCFPDRSCAVLEPSECDAMGGTPQGVATDCAMPTFCPPPFVVNDECPNALEISPLPALVPGFTLSAGNDVAPFCGTSDGTGGGVWYTVIGTGATITLTTCENQPGGGSATYDTKIRVYCSCDGLECVAGNDDESNCSFHSTVSFCSQVGVEYRVLVHGFGAAEGSFMLAAFDDGVPCAAAVLCVPPTPIGGCCFTIGPCGEGECVDGLEQLECAAQGGVYQGDESTCAVLDGPMVEARMEGRINCVTPDTDPPVVTCAVTSECDADGDSSGSSESASFSSVSSCSSSEQRDVITFSAFDECGDASVEAQVITVCEADGFVITKTVQVQNGQAVDMRCNGNGVNDSSSEAIECSSAIVNGILTIRADSAVVIVTATDEAGNTASCEVDLCHGPG